MGNKGEQTRELIKNASYNLFAEKGFKEVTMQDICEKTGLSRGGLYRHYGSTASIFEEIFHDLVNASNNDFQGKIDKGCSAKSILEDILIQLREEMLDKKRSLSYAIYEYSDVTKSDLFEKLNRRGEKSWIKLIEYGINRNEFNKVEVEQVVDIILYSYQGVRMWSRIVPISEITVDNIINHIRDILEVDNETIN